MGALLKVGAIELYLKKSRNTSQIFETLHFLLQRDFLGLSDSYLGAFFNNTRLIPNFVLTFGRPDQINVYYCAALLYMINVSTQKGGASHSYR
ncbi:hypothetical protein J18TS1_42310 [Oceanobacillus oncorhynchi subsp. incaldanensis]|nr:hypothetical protein J18TS1_42310 [Oceanobacillus oncorhynchi subsp. incaldanensis]